ncbi:TIGR01212 family radical SAM protein [uncultured Chitinibacter sp.]|uniref:TIGR01212 family radical SAM protein n=2 Tax=Chitinibacter TaxID=230666 RepID=UPI0025989162|nr:TIGR01212 family radical SAM protein [uncultured Chitinibacter sp.]
MMHDLIPPLLHERRYLAWHDLVRAKAGGRVQKISVAAGFSCPNRDGRLGVGGCTFCNNRGFTPGYVTEHLDNLYAQIDTGLEFLQRRYPRTRQWLAYFQAYSNTYAPQAALRAAYQHALAHPRISGLVIGTRPDCLPDATLDLLAELAHSVTIELEIGVESTSDAALHRVKRGHDYACSVDAIERAAARGLTVSAHLMLGLPGESRASMLAGATRLSRLPLAALKLHQLQVVKGTQLANQWRRNPLSVPLLEQDEYLQLLVEFLERMRPDLALQRLGSEVPPRLRLAPNWSVRQEELGRLLSAELVRQNTWQGRLWMG